MRAARMREVFEKWDAEQREANQFRSDAETFHDSIVWQAAYAGRDEEVEELKAQVEEWKDRVKKLCV